jgi:transcriptional regulator with XRE-family HTH domain
MGASRSKALEEVRAKLRAAAKESGMTLEEIGLAMGYSKSGARQAVSRMLNSSTDYDPRLTTLMQFAVAVNSSLSNILSS